MNLVFCGTPQFAVPVLEAVLAGGHQVALVLTQPDRPSGRGLQLLASPVKQVALAAGLPVEQPVKIKTNDVLRAQLEAIAPDAILVVAYGRLIPPWMLALPRYGNLNLHGSLLPKYRGAAPIQWAVAEGETVTGVTTMRLDEGLDTGDVLLARELPIRPDQTAEELYAPLAEIGAKLMLETLAGLNAGTILPRPQQHNQASLAPILTREDGRIDPRRSAREVYNRWRGFQPWPGAWSTLGGRKFSVTRMAPVPDAIVLDVSAPTAGQHAAEPGTLLAHTGRLYLKCGVAAEPALELDDASAPSLHSSEAAWVELLEVQMEGKRSMAAAEFLRGTRLEEGARLG